MKENAKTKISVVKGFDRKDFEKWCLEKNKNPQNDLSIAEYLAKELKHEGSIEFLNSYEKGEASLDNLHIKFMDDEEEIEEDIEIQFGGLIKIIEGISELGNVEIEKGKKFFDDLKSIDEGAKKALVVCTMEKFGDEFLKLMLITKECLELAKFLEKLGGE